MIYILILLGCFAYIWIAGAFFTYLRMQYFALVNERNFSYEIMEKSTDASFVDHLMAITWPIIAILMLLIHIIKRIRG